MHLEMLDPRSVFGDGGSEQDTSLAGALKHYGFTTGSRNWSGTCPPIPGGLAICLDLLPISEQLRTSSVFPNSVHRAVEVARLTVGSEDLEVVEGTNRALAQCKSAMLGWWLNEAYRHDHAG